MVKTIKGKNYRQKQKLTAPVTDKKPPYNPFYANDCYVCHKTKNLKRCSRCNLISYCGPDHQKQHWSDHKDICNVTSTIMKQKGLSHVFENLRDSDSTKWREERLNMVAEVKLRLGRSLLTEEKQIFYFPRACFVCYDSRQDKLKSCPHCPSASFCEKHPSSSQHDQDCSKIKDWHCQDINHNNFDVATDAATYRNIIEATPIQDSLKPPSSMQEYLDEYLDPPLEISRELKIHVSYYLSVPLTVYSALKKMQYPFKSEMILLLEKSTLQLFDSKLWETLLHLESRLKVLKVVMTKLRVSQSSQDVKLCKKCNSENKRVIVEAVSSSYVEYMYHRDYQDPDVLAIFDYLYPQSLKTLTSEELIYATWEKLKCPILLTLSSKQRMEELTKVLKAGSKFFQFCYEGFNEFHSLRFSRDWEGVCTPNLFMSVVKTIPIKTENLSRNFFSASLCQVCRLPKPSVSCHCKMIFYCGQKHLEEDQPQHEELCQVLQRFPSKTVYPIDKVKKTEELIYKQYLKLSVEVKLKRRLFDYESDIIFYQKTCFVCHESDIGVLKTCDCGTSLCKKHQDDPKHQQLCSGLSLALKILMTGEPPILKVSEKFYSRNSNESLPTPIEGFIDSYLSVKEETSEIIKKLKIPNFPKILISNLLTRPLTFLYALEKLNFQVEKSMIVHVIGAIDREILEEGYWEFILIWLRRLVTFKIVFIGPEISNLTHLYRRNLGTYPINGKMQYASHCQTRYDDYVGSDYFEKPDIIIGFNLDLHESQFQTSGCTWKNTFLTLAKLKVPFVMTSGSEERAKQDHKRICSLLDNVDYDFCERNPFGSLVPERDFGTLGLRYSNNYVMIYKGLGQTDVAETEPKEGKVRTKIVEWERKTELGFMKYVIKRAANGMTEESDIGHLEGKTNLDVEEHGEEKKSPEDKKTTKTRKCKTKSSESKGVQTQPMKSLEKGEIKDNGMKLTSGVVETNKNNLKPDSVKNLETNKMKPGSKNLETDQKIKSADVKDSKTSKDVVEKTTDKNYPGLVKILEKEKNLQMTSLSDTVNTRQEKQVILDIVKSGIQNLSFHYHISKTKTDNFETKGRSEKVDSVIKETELEVEDLESKMSSSTAQNLSFGKETPGLKIIPDSSKISGNERKSNASNDSKKPDKNSSRKSKSAVKTKEQLFYEEKQKLLKETLLLREKRDRLKKDNLYLQKEYERVIEENRFFKDVQYEVKEGIRLAMKSKR